MFDSTRNPLAARRHLEAAVALEPANDTARVSLSFVLALLGDWTAAFAAVDGASEGTQAAVRVRWAMWRRDAALAESVLPTIERIHPSRAMLVRRMALLITTGEPLYGVLPSFSPGLHVAHLVRMFFVQTEIECACILGDRARALAALARADADQLHGIAWLDRCPLVAPVRAEPAFDAIRARVAERAEAVVREYRARDRD